MLSLRMMAAPAQRERGRRAAGITDAQALQGLMEPEDMAETYLFLASDKARNITASRSVSIAERSMVTGLAGKRALVTGAANGIGRATALALQEKVPL